MDDVRTRVLTAATELFAELGYDATSVQQVVARAGVTKGALYHYFSSKEELLFEIYGSVIAEQLAGLDQVLARQMAPEPTLRAIVADVLETNAASEPSSTWSTGTRSRRSGAATRTPSAASSATRRRAATSPPSPRPR